MRPNSKIPRSNEGNGSLRLHGTIRWQGLDTAFTDSRIITNFRPGFDRLPKSLDLQLGNSAPGDKLRQAFKPGELLDPYRPELRRRLPRECFRPPEPAMKTGIGRFHPVAWFQGLELPAKTKPAYCRIIDLDDRHITVDLNHPLAGKDIELELQILGMDKTSQTPGAPPKDLAALLCNEGPGMQDRLPERETDFDDRQPLPRLDEGDDAAFFGKPSLEPYWSRAALEQVSRLYRRLLQPGQRVLDLMAGVHSPLQEAGIESLSVSCAGLNAVELDHNPVCSERRALNVNRDLPLPWPERHFNAVLIHAAIEYVTRPNDLFGEVHRVLQPGGQLIITFSNHWVEEKVARLWACLQDFEHHGLLLSWLRRQGGFTNFRGCSIRDLPDGAEPVHAIRAKKFINNMQG